MPNHFSLARRPDLQGLRAIAILLVVLGHARIPGFTGGFVGVDVFFVLSGYLITGILLREFRTTGKIAYLQFICRRLKRLLPALMVMLTVIILAANWFLSSREFINQSGSFNYAATWTSNIFFAFREIDYFAEMQTRDLFLHTWSLGVEEQFYLAWPLVLLGILLIPKWLRGGDTGRHLLAFLGTVFIASLAVELYWAQKHPLWSFYLMPSRIWQFALGATVFLLTENNQARIARVIQAHPTFNGALGLLLVIGSAVLLHPNVTYPGYWALLPSIGTALILATKQRAHGDPAINPLSHPALVWIGDRSYSWYLWHWPLLMLGFSITTGNPVVTSAALAVLALAIAAVSYRFVELPFWKGNYSGLRPAYTLLASSALVVLLLLTVQFTGLLQPHKKTRSLSERAFHDTSVIYKVNCDTWYHDADLRPCVLSEGKYRKTVVLFADSIGAQWFSLIQALYDPKQWRIVVLTKSSCPIVDEDFFYERIGKVFTICREWRNKAIDHIGQLNADTIIIGSDTTYGFNENQWIDGTRRILARLEKVSRQVIVLPGTPELGFDGPGCLEKNPGTGAQRCRKKLPAQSHTLDVVHYLQEAVKPLRKTRVLDLVPFACPDGYCSASDGPIVVFRDNKHLTDTYVRSQIPAIKLKMEKLGMIQQ